MKPKTHRRHRDDADEILFLPEEDLLPPTEECLAANARRTARTLRVSECESPYGDQASFVVRTALIRADTWDPEKAATLSSPDAVAALCRHLAVYDQENIVSIAVDSRLRVVAIHEVALGTMDASYTDMRQLAKVAFLSGAASMFMVHNHPSGVPSPSAEDKRITNTARDALACIGVKLLDHVIVAHEGWYSFTQEAESRW